MRIAVTKTAEKMLPEFERSKGQSGFVCAQVNPLRAGDRDCMLAMAKRFHAWAPNISVKLPATAAGLDVLEDCVADGIHVTATVSFTVPQALAIAERHRAGTERAREKGIEPGKCFAVIMIGRLDDFLREVAHDNQAAVSEADIRLSGLAVTKRAYQIYKERGYDAVLLVAALRGPYHMTELAGADLLMSIHPRRRRLSCRRTIRARSASMCRCRRKRSSGCGRCRSSCALTSRTGWRRRISSGSERRSGR